MFVVDCFLFEFGDVGSCLFVVDNVKFSYEKFFVFF